MTSWLTNVITRSPPLDLMADCQVVANLPIIEVTEEKLSEWGPECMCAVCTCEVALGDQIQVLQSDHVPYRSRYRYCSLIIACR